MSFETISGVVTSVRDLAGSFVTVTLENRPDESFAVGLGDEFTHPRKGDRIVLIGRRGRDAKFGTVSWVMLEEAAS